MSRKYLGGKVLTTASSNHLRKLAIDTPDLDTDLDTKNWMKMNRTGLRTNPQDLDRLTPEDLGKRIKNKKEAEEVRRYIDSKHPELSERFSDEKILADIETFHNRQARFADKLNSAIAFKNNPTKASLGEQLSTLSNSTTPNRVGILTKGNVRELLNKPR